MPLLDVEKYMKYLESEDLTAEEKRQCIEALWNFADSIVKKAHKRHPIQEIMRERRNDSFTKK